MSARPCSIRTGPRIVSVSGSLAFERGDDGVERRVRRGTGRPARGRRTSRARRGRRGSAVVDLRVERLRAVAEAGLDVQVRVGDVDPAHDHRREAAQAARAASARAAARPARRCGWPGANATRAARASARASTCAAATPPTARRGRPASGRRSRRACRSVVELARGADHVEHAAALGDADQVRVRRRACRGPRSRCARRRSRPSASG